MERLIKEINNYLETEKEEKFIFDEKIIDFNRDNFFEIKEDASDSLISFVDGGSGELINTGNLCLSFIKVGYLKFKGLKKEKFFQQRFYLLTKTTWRGKTSYLAKIFPDGNSFLTGEFSFDPYDLNLKEGKEKAPIEKVTSLIRRFAELNLAKMISLENDFVVIDGDLEERFPGENKFLDLPKNVYGLAKTSTLFTNYGHSLPFYLLKNSPQPVWAYYLTEKEKRRIYFVKLNRKSPYVFRFEGNDSRPVFLLVKQSQDPLFLGYPYGLIMIDKLIRVTERERRILTDLFLARFGNKSKELKELLSSVDAHRVLNQI